VRRCRREHGLTLIELVISLVILAIASVAILRVLSDANRRSADPMIQQQASAIAQAYLEEVLLKPYCDPDLSTDCASTCAVANICATPACSSPEAGRTAFDEVCDYDGLVDSGARNQLDQAIPALADYTVTVRVDDSGVDINGLSADAGQALRITVSVDHPAMAPISLSAYRTNF